MLTKVHGGVQKGKLNRGVFSLVSILLLNLGLILAVYKAIKYGFNLFWDTLPRKGVCSLCKPLPSFSLFKAYSVFFAMKSLPKCEYKHSWPCAGLKASSYEY